MSLLWVPDTRCDCILWSWGGRCFIRCILLSTIVQTADARYKLEIDQRWYLCWSPASLSSEESLMASGWWSSMGNFHLQLLTIMTEGFVWHPHIKGREEGVGFFFVFNWPALCCPLLNTVMLCLHPSLCTDVLFFPHFMTTKHELNARRTKSVVYYNVYKDPWWWALYISWRLSLCLLGQYIEP